jgi:hypothetical protein
MNIVIDTSFLLGREPDSVRLLSEIRAGSGNRLAVDSPDGPCFNEWQAHSVDALIPGSPWRPGPLPDGALSHSVRLLLRRLIRRTEYRIRMYPHDPDPTGDLARALRGLLATHRLQLWWDEDRMWVSLAQGVGGARIFSCDRAFCTFKSVLTKYGIELQYHNTGGTRRVDRPR